MKTKNTYENKVLALFLFLFAFVFFTAPQAAVYAQSDPKPEDKKGQGSEDIQCEASAGTLSWVVCGITELGENFVKLFFEKFLRPLLEDVPVSLDPKEGSFKAWQGFRVIANILLVTAMLAIVYAQARGEK